MENNSDKKESGNNKKVESGSTVSILYVGTTDNGEIFDKVEDKSNPFKFKVGAGQVLPRFEEALIGMEVGDKKKIHLDSKDAYGDVKEQLVIEIPRNLVDGKVELVKGKKLMFRTPDGTNVYATIKDFNDSSVKLDLNHPLAGKNINFDIEMVAIE